MIDLLLVCLGLSLGASCLALGPSLWMLAAVVGSTGFLLGALLLRRTALLVLSASLEAVGFLAGLLSAPVPRIWLAVAFGVGLLTMIDVGWDRVRTVQARLSRQAYARRLGHLARCGIVSFATVFVVVTLGYSTRLRYGLSLPFAAAVLAAAAVGAGAALLVRAELGRSGRRGPPAA